MATMRSREDSAIEIRCEAQSLRSDTNPPKATFSPKCSPATPQTPKTPDRSEKNSSQPRSPVHSPQALTTETIVKQLRTPEPNTYNSYVPPGCRHHHVPSDISRRKRSMLNHFAYRTQSDAMKFHRIVEWDGTWLSTLSLPPLEYYNAVYFEATFPATYRNTEDISRVQQCWVGGREPDCGIDVHSALGGKLVFTVNFEQLSMENLFDFGSYYGDEGEPEQTAAEEAGEKAMWKCQSRELKSKTGCPSKDALLRTENDTQTRWLNQR